MAQWDFTHRAEREWAILPVPPERATHHWPCPGLALPSWQCPGCFVCGQCGANLSGKEFAVHQGKPYCPGACIEAATPAVPYKMPSFE